MRFSLILSIIIAFLSINIISIGNPVSDTVKHVDSLKSAKLNWYNLDITKDSIMGTSVDLAYEKLLQNKESKKKIIVAIIDVGVDIYHEDLKGKIWVNKDEIPNNNIDDDKNGYIDDINGWNYLGNKDGKNIRYENLELTRILKKHLHSFDDIKSKKDIPDYLKADYEMFLRAKKEYSKKKKSNIENLTYLELSASLIPVYEKQIKEYLKKDSYTIDELKNIESDSDEINQAKKFLLTVSENGINENYINKMKSYYNDSNEKYLNLDFNPREIVGDNHEDITDIDYGNNNVIGPDSFHGTFIAGIIGANRDNDIGINGIANNVEFMVLRAVPDGDEYDKDIALAIKYAVDNGANIINMSFGKYYSPHKQYVDEAVKHAEKNNVLLIHAAGNDSYDVNKNTPYPNNKYNNGEEIKGWMNIGATEYLLDIDLIADFSNYGNDVSLFAPGHDIISLHQNNQYKVSSGTSFAAPVVSGIAALIWSYYPELTAIEIKDILIKSCIQHPKLKVFVPSQGRKKKKTKFKKLSSSQGIVNAYKALELAEEYSNNK